jgi:hypothetical protein
MSYLQVVVWEIFFPLFGRRAVVESVIGTTTYTKYDRKKYEKYYR